MSFVSQFVPSGNLTSVRKVKTVDQAVTSSTTLVADNELSIPVGPNETYLVEYSLPVTFGTVGQSKVAIDAPVGSTLARASSSLIPNGIVPAFASTAVLGAAMSLTAALASSGVINGTAVVTTGDTAGNITLKFAQNTSSGTPTTILAGATLLVNKL